MSKEGKGFLFRGTGNPLWECRGSVRRRRQVALGRSRAVARSGVLQCFRSDLKQPRQPADSSEVSAEVHPCRRAGHRTQLSAACAAHRSLRKSCLQSLVPCFKAKLYFALRPGLEEPAVAFWHPELLGFILHPTTLASLRLSSPWSPISDRGRVRDKRVRGRRCEVTCDDNACFCGPRLWWVSVPACITSSALGDGGAFAMGQI